MSHLQRKATRNAWAIAGVAMMLPNLAVAQPQGAAPQAEQPNRVAIEYVAPKTSELGDLYEVLKSKRVLEQIQKILSPLRLPEELTVKTTECGKVNAWYKRENFKPTVTICYEPLKRVLDTLPKETTPAGITPNDAKIGQVLWVTLHEVGHATFDIHRVPIFGNGESAADNFATYILLQFAEARRLIGGAAWAGNAYMRDYKRNPVVQIRLAGFASDHGLPQERFYNLVCIAFGAAPAEFADFAQEYLPPTRSSKCKYEYQALADAFQKEIGPHIDRELAKGIVEANWLSALASDPQK
jgi:hypothetical protein